MPELSIILPTCNRANLLERAIHSITANTRADFEIIVVDGASSDHTAHVLDSASAQLGGRLTAIREPLRQGFVRAVNKGFKAATGKYMTWINDDARPLPGAYDIALQQLKLSPGDVGLLAMFHHFHSDRNIAYQTMHAGVTFSLCHVRGTLYANFGIGKRETFKQLGYFDERFFLGASDPDFSLKCWQSGKQVVPAYGAMIDHDETQDDRRATDTAVNQEDNRKLFAKWKLPQKNLYRNDFNPQRPCTLQSAKLAA